MVLLFPSNLIVMTHLWWSNMIKNIQNVVQIGWIPCNSKLQPEIQRSWKMIVFALEDWLCTIVFIHEKTAKNLIYFRYWAFSYAFEKSLFWPIFIHAQVFVVTCTNNFKLRYSPNNILKNFYGLARGLMVENF